MDTSCVELRLCSSMWLAEHDCVQVDKENNSCHPGAHGNLVMCFGINLVQKWETERSSLF